MSRGEKHFSERSRIRLIYLAMKKLFEKLARGLAPEERHIYSNVQNREVILLPALRSATAFGVRRLVAALVETYTRNDSSKNRGSTGEEWNLVSLKW
jgi:hypothetical protein